MSTGIEWTDETWNPVTGCTKISPGCKHCYAEAIAERFWGARKFTDVRTVEHRLQEPLHRRKPTRYFVNSMSDLFHEDVPFEFIGKVWGVCSEVKWHTFQILTKRIERALEFSNWLGSPWSANVWLGVSVENQKFADERIPILLQVPAAIRFLSVEPMLDSIMLPRQVFLPTGLCGDWPFGHTTRVGGGNHLAFSNPLGALSVRADDGKLLGIKPNEFTDKGLGVDWIICGGESGPGAREFNLDWGNSLRLQACDAAVPFFMKQIGSNPVAYSDVMKAVVRWPHKDSKGGDMSEWPPNIRVRQFPERREVAA